IRGEVKRRADHLVLALEPDGGLPVSVHRVRRGLPIEPRPDRLELRDNRAAALPRDPVAPQRPALGPRPGAPAPGGPPPRPPPRSPRTQLDVRAGSPGPPPRRRAPPRGRAGTSAWCEAGSRRRSAPGHLGGPDKQQPLEWRPPAQVPAGGPKVEPRPEPSGESGGNPAGTGGGGGRTRPGRWRAGQGTS